MTLPPHSPPALRVVLADDHQIFLEGLRRIIEPEAEIVGTALNGEELLEVALSTKPDLVVTDYSMPGLSGLDAVDKIRDGGHSPKVIILTMHLDAEYATRAISCGVDGYVLKSAAATDLIAAVREVARGGRWLSPTLTTAMLKTPLNTETSACSMVQSLTDRQRGILKLLVKGMSAKEIAQELGLSSKTIEYHKYRMMGELGVSTSAELIGLAVSAHLEEV